MIDAFRNGFRRAAFPFLKAEAGTDLLKIAAILFDEIGSDHGRSDIFAGRETDLIVLALQGIRIERFATLGARYRLTVLPYRLANHIATRVKNYRGVAFLEVSENLETELRRILGEIEIGVDAAEPVDEDDRLRFACCLIGDGPGFCGVAHCDEVLSNIVWIECSHDEVTFCAMRRLWFKKNTARHVRLCSVCVM